MRKRQRTLKPSFVSFVDVSVDTKSYPTHKSVVSMIREERRGFQSPVVWVVWTRRCAGLIHVP